VHAVDAFDTLSGHAWAFWTSAVGTAVVGLLLHDPLTTPTECPPENTLGNLSGCKNTFGLYVEAINETAFGYFVAALFGAVTVALIWLAALVAYMAKKYLFADES
jgi:hypothetical protein